MNRISTLTLSALLGMGGPVLAYETGSEHMTHAQATPAMIPTPTKGLVRKVDKEAKKITLKHEAIENLGMDGMTMVFQVKDPALLNNVKAGDEVRFTADRIKGAYVVLTIERVAN